MRRSRAARQRHALRRGRLGAPAVDGAETRSATSGFSSHYPGEAVVAAVAWRNTDLLRCVRNARDPAVGGLREKDPIPGAAQWGWPRLGCTSPAYHLRDRRCRARSGAARLAPRWPFGRCGAICRSGWLAVIRRSRVPGGNPVSTAPSAPPESWRVPAAALALMAVVFSLSTFVIGPAITGADQSDTASGGEAAPANAAQEPAHEAHH